MESPFLYSVTDFGNSAVLIPVSAAVFLWLLFQPSKHLAGSWLVASGVCLASIAVLKLWFFVCPANPNLHSPSGHTSLSTLVYGALAMVAAVHCEGWRRGCVAAVGIFAVLSIAVSRVLLGAHTVVETGLGLATGFAALAIFFAAYSMVRPKFVYLRALFLCVALLVVLLHGQQLHAEELLQAFGIYMKAGGVSCS